MEKISKIFQAIMYWPIFLLLKFMVKYEIYGQENLQGLEGRSIVFASNHASYLDGLFSGVSLPRKGWYPKNFFPIRIPVTERFFKWYFNIIAIFVRLAGCIRLTKNGHALKDICKALRKNSKVWIYPEGGWEDENKGQVQKGRPGIAFLQKETGSVIVPVGIMGNFGILSFGTLLRKNKVIVNIGKPIFTLDDPEHCTLQQGTDKVMKKIQQLIEMADNI
jgi:1-acyl-sn-glycerol-3-phosphate acyltransferase